MFLLAFEFRYRVLYIRYSGVFTSDDIEQSDEAARRFFAEAGPTNSILDWSDLQAFAVPETRMVERGRRPQIALDHLRVMVTPNRMTYDVIRAFADQQRDFGNVEPVVVRSMSDACRVLGLVAPRFEPVCHGGELELSRFSERETGRSL